MHPAGDRTRQLVLLGMLLGLALANVGQFPAIEANTGDHWRAIYRYESGDLSDIARSPAAPSNVYARFGLSLSLGKAAPNSTFVAPEGLRLNRTLATELLFGLAYVDDIERADYDHTEIPDVDDFVVAQGQGGDRGQPYRIAVLGPEADRVALFASEDPVEFTVVDVRLLDANHPAVQR